ncbi:unnamed protein product [Peniophora sp. CBMAI 1063]|nr:unnamed protein product [Peniophora sp. CBMAI 1063]
MRLVCRFWKASADDTAELWGRLFCFPTSECSWMARALRHTKRMLLDLNYLAPPFRWVRLAKQEMDEALAEGRVRQLSLTVSESSGYRLCQWSSVFWKLNPANLERLEIKADRSLTYGDLMVIDHTAFCGKTPHILHHLTLDNHALKVDRESRLFDTQNLVYLSLTACSLPYTVFGLLQVAENNPNLSTLILSVGSRTFRSMEEHETQRRERFDLRQLRTLSLTGRFDVLIPVLGGIRLEPKQCSLECDVELDRPTRQPAGVTRDLLNGAIQPYLIEAFGDGAEAKCLECTANCMPVPFYSVALRIRGTSSSTASFLLKLGCEISGSSHYVNGIFQSLLDEWMFLGAVDTIHGTRAPSTFWPSTIPRLPSLQTIRITRYLGELGNALLNQDPGQYPKGLVKVELSDISLEEGALNSLKGWLKGSLQDGSSSRTLRFVRCAVKGTTGKDEERFI